MTSGIICAAIGLTAASAFAHLQPDSATTAPESTQPSMEVAVGERVDSTFDSNGVTIRYVVEGEGEAVVLIHGWMADSSMWGRDPSGNTDLDTASAPGFRFIALDCRGHGKSDKPHDQEQYGPEMAADVIRLLDHLKIEKAHLVGYSMGAYIAGKVAATCPERVLSVISAGQAPILADAESTEESSDESSGSSEIEIFAKAVEKDDLGAYVMAVMPETMPQPTKEQADAIAKFMFTGKDLEALAAAGLSFDDLAVTVESLKACETPILFIRGENESDEVKKRIDAVRTLLGRGDLVVIEGGNHVTTLIKPEFGSAVIEFLRASRQIDPQSEGGQ